METKIVEAQADFVYVTIGMSAYSGTVASPKTLSNPDLDPKVISSGEIKVVNNDTLKVFSTIRTRARSACLRHGTSFMGGFAVSQKAWPMVKEQLDEIAKEFEEEGKRFTSNYERYVQEWAETSPSMSEIIKEFAHPKEWIAGRFVADFSASYLAPAQGMEDAMKKQVAGMFDSIIHEIAVSARQAIKGYLAGKSRVSRKILSSFEQMLDKLNSLSFVDTRLDPIAKAIEEHLFLLQLPKEGKYEEEDQSRIAMMLQLMSDERNIVQLADLLKHEQAKLNNMTKASSGAALAASASTAASPVNAEASPSTDEEESNDASAESLEEDSEELFLL